MCGRYAVEYPEEFEARFGLHSLPAGLKPRYNVAPGQVLPVVVERGGRNFLLMRWGLVPFWAKDEKIGYKMINARAEGIEEKASFRKPFQSQRCLVPAVGFYEWAMVDKRKQPYFFHRKDGGLFAFAGLYDVWHKEGKELKTFTIITCEPNRMVKPVHARMPFVLDKQSEEMWLDEQCEMDKLIRLLKSREYEEWEGYKVSVAVNNPANDEAMLIRKEDDL